ncbi:uncharacterized protein LOC119737800 [Patiria miniata]|uniref:Thioredoxin domain-containing protein n=1 Tax=Patiria miniata TaxID=46514 RepID=A0A914AXC1_PATMI|nr:uncharacterized protein LOC119737800 [Patiria miniata]
MRILFCMFALIVNHSQAGAYASSTTQPQNDAQLSSPQGRASQSLGQYADTDNHRSSTTQPDDGASGQRSNTEHPLHKEDASDAKQLKRESLEQPVDASYPSSKEGDASSLLPSTAGTAADDGVSVEEEGTVSAAKSEVSHQELLPVFKEAMLGYYIKRAIHHPVCVLFRPHGPVPNLEKDVHKFWVKAQMQKNNLYGMWRMGAFINQSKPTRGFRVPDQLPVLRCFIWTAQPTDHRGSGKAKDLHRWFTKQAVKYRDRIPEFSSEALDKLPSNIELVLIMFVNAESHHEIETHMYEYQIRESYTDSTQLFVVHPGSDDVDRLMEQYRIRTLPSVIVLDPNDTVKNRVVQKFEGPESSFERLRAFLRLRMSPITILTLHNFESSIISPKEKRLPTLVCFHAPWGRDTGSYLDALQRSAAEFHLGDGTGLQFKSLELTQHAEVVTRWVDATYAKSVPFSVLFWWEETEDMGVVLQQKLLPDVTPTPWTVATFLEQNQVSIYNAQGEELQYSPWEGHDIDNEISYGFTSYTPNLCTSYANSSLGIPDDVYNQDMCDPTSLQPTKKSKVKNKGENKAPERQKSLWVKKKSSTSSQPMIGKIPQVTDTSWASIVERSQTPGGALRLAKPWRKDVTSTTLVVFIQTDCSNCRRKMVVFERLVDSLKMIDGASMYIMNCTSDPVTCSQLRVIGFPTLIAFRGYGEIGSENCVSPGHANQLIRMDFHGMLEEKSIMEWFSEISLPAVKHLPSIKQFQQSTFQKEDVILLATMYPLSLAGRYLPALASTHRWYPLECYRVACEQLYGRASCLAAISENLGSRDVERSKRDKDMIVTQVEMLRKDGIKSLIFSLGRNLMVTLQDESDSQIHAFHSPHKYNLKEGQRCEDDPASCTDLIVAFVQDHGRLPVTHLTMTGFHTHSGTKFGEHHENSIFEHNLPVLIALANKGHLMEGAQFIEAFTSAAYEFYNQMVFVSLNTDEFPKWASRFVPVGYRQKILEYGDRITQDLIPSLNVYPRLCIVRQDDHRHAAMFPPAERFTLAQANSPRVVTKDEIATFAREFLRMGDEMMLQTEQF